MGRTRARRRARPVSPPQFGLRFTDIFLDNERSLAVELQLAHVEQNKVKAVYHKASLHTTLIERRALLQQYADYLGVQSQTIRV